MFYVSFDLWGGRVCLSKGKRENLESGMKELDTAVICELDRMYFRNKRK